ncbi:MAG: citramalate synthase [Thiohalorhabdus sp.]|uniref:citramalate synthase n=1 Tax=Thiohalorhabdus sp. TaxID=3094134 RepID=UPI0039805EFC
MTHSTDSIIEVFDTTLRDGGQSEAVSFSVEDKLHLAEALDHLGVDFIEGGWPGANPRDDAFFEAARERTLRHARLLAFGSTMRTGNTPGEDPVLSGLVAARPDGAVVFGKAWDLHVELGLGIGLEENLALVRDSVAYLKEQLGLVLFDAEHFFDGYANHPDYALRVLEAAAAGGADRLVLCDTNGGGLPAQIGAAVDAVRERLPGAVLGIHCHNDGALAVANSLAAVDHGVRHVQGTLNGLGERCGNADLTAVLPNLILKLGYRGAHLGPEELERLTATSRLVDELANRSPRNNQPFVGQSAFAHKGGVHVSAVRKDARTYEHIAPEAVGNVRRILVSDQSGKSNIVHKLQELGLLERLEGDDAAVAQVVERIKDLEHQGYQFEGADASFELVVRRVIGDLPEFFRLVGFRVLDAKRHAGEAPESEATVMLEVGGERAHTAGTGNGPVNALDHALRKALAGFYPELREMDLVDFKVRVVSAGGGTDAAVRVLIESGDPHDHWGTVGVSANVIEASYQALVDAVTYKLAKNGRSDHLLADGATAEASGAGVGEN